MATTKKPAGKRSSSTVKPAKAQRVAKPAKAASARAAPTKDSAAKDYPSREDHGAAIEEYLAELDGEVGEAARALAQLVRDAVPDATAEIKWGMPVFEKDGLLCYLRARGNYVGFGFYDHADVMSDPEERLEGTGRGKHVKVRSLGEIDRIRFAEWVKLAAKRNAAGART